MKLLFALLVLALAAAAQTEAPPSTQQVNMPSDAEIGELLSKASQKVASFQEALQNAKPYLDQQDPKLAFNYADTAKTAQDLIKVAQKEGVSAYRLVALLSLLDDLTVDAANGSFRLMLEDTKALQAKRANVQVLAAIPPLNAAQTGLNDISELLLHATLRYIGAEEQALLKLLNSADKAK